MSRVGRADTTGPPCRTSPTPAGSPDQGSTTTSAARNSCSPNSAGTSARIPRIIHEIRLLTSLSSVEKLQAVVRALVLQRAGAPERFRVLDRTEAALPDETAAVQPECAPGGPRRDEDTHRRRRVQRRVLSPGTSGWQRCPSSACATGSPGGSRRHQPPAEPVADQLAQNAIDILAYREGTESPTTAPHGASDGPGEPRLPRAPPQSRVPP